jgi:hypothetical protein
VYVPIKDQVSSLVARLVPFPIGAPPGDRRPARRHRQARPRPAGGPVVEGGGQVDQIGNAPAFGQATTTLTYTTMRSATQGEAARRPRRG